MLPLPPPFSGQEKIAKIILNSRIVEAFNSTHVDTSLKHSDNSSRGLFLLSSILKTVSQSLLVWKLIRRNKFDLVYTPLISNSLGFLRFTLLILPSIVSRIKIVSRMGGENFMQFYTSRGKVYKYLIIKTLSHIDAIIVRGENQKKQFVGIYNGRLETIYAPSTGVRKKTKKSNYINEKKVTKVLFLGLLSPAKGIYDLLRAIPLVLENDNSYFFDFVGDFIKRDTNVDLYNHEIFNIKNFIIKHKLGKYLKFHGGLFGRDKKMIFENADTFVFPSYSEGQPFSVLEAMEYGLPVISTKVGNLPEIFKCKENILFVKKKSPVDLSKAILRIKDQTLCRKLINNSQLTLTNKLSINIYEEKIIDLFCKTISLKN